MFGGGTPEECLCFMEKAKTVYVGQRMWEGPLRYNLMKQLLFGGALAAFNNKASELGAKTMVHFQKCVKAVVSQSFPHKALAYQKKWMRNAMQKPVDMTMREFITRVREINNYLSDFPPFEGEDQKLDEEELIEIAKNGSPVKWQNEIICQDFDKNDPTLDEYVQFFDRLATSEGKTVTYAADNLRNIDDRIPRKRTRLTGDMDDYSHSLGELFCDFCGKRGHDTFECRHYKKAKLAINDMSTSKYSKSHSNKPYAKKPYASKKPYNKKKRTFWDKDNQSHKEKKWKDFNKNLSAKKR